MVPEGPSLFSPSERRALLTFARAVLEAAVRGHDQPPVASGEAFERRVGAFVTLTAGAELRGCIGHPTPDQTLGLVLADCAIAAALRDPRFPPVAIDELRHLHVEISVLTPPVPIAVADIEVGRHGLIVSLEGRRGLLLPQVAEGRGWTREDFLDQTCRKAGLRFGAWRGDAQISAFEAEIFGEADLRCR